MTTDENVTPGSEDIKNSDEIAEGTGTPPKESELIVRFSIHVPKEDVERDVDLAAAKYAKEIKLPGFRMGKVPVDVVKSRFKEGISDEVLNKIIEKAIFEKIEKEKIKIASQPHVEKIDYEEGKDLNADVMVEIFPTIQLPELDQVEVEIPAAELKFEEFDEQKQIDAILEGHKRQTPVAGREIRENDEIVYKYQSKILDTKRLTPQTQQYFRVNEKEENEIMDFYKEILGKNAGDSFTLNRTYPPDYKKKAWADKQIEHYIAIERINEMVKPEFDETFLKTMGFDSAENFKERLKAEYDLYKKKHTEDVTIKHITEFLVKTLSFPIPDGIVENEVRRVISHYPNMNFQNDEQSRMFHNSLREESEKSVRWIFISDAIKENFKLEVVSEELEKEYKTVSERNGVPIKEVRKFYMQKENAQHLRETLVNNKITNLLLEKIKIKEV